MNPRKPKVPACCWADERILLVISYPDADGLLSGTRNKKNRGGGGRKEAHKSLDIIALQIIDSISRDNDDDDDDGPFKQSDLYFI